MQQFVKAPSSSLVYGVDWSVRYPGDTILTLAVAAGGTLTAKALPIAGLRTLATVAGGALAELSPVTFTVSLGSGQTDTYTLNFLIAQT